MMHSISTGAIPTSPLATMPPFFWPWGPLDSKTGQPQYIVIMEQWKGLTEIKKREIFPKGRFSHIPGGTSDSNIVENFWVVQ